jgi:membrane-associated protease RseP (regulator of RpoE activity)
MHAQIAATCIAASLAFAGYPTPSAGQSERDAQEQERSAREQQRQAEREGAERKALEQNLAQAREELERAAQEVARLSRQFAEPFAASMLQHWQSFGRRALLGLSPEDTELGVRVAGVSPGGPAAQAGIQVGDVIVEIDGAALADPRGRNGNGQSPTELLLAQMGHVEPGESVTLKLRRDGDEREVTLQTRERNAFSYDYGIGPRALPAPARWPGMFGGNPWQDMQLVTLTPELGSYFGTNEGILVVRGPENDALGLRDGDVIVDIGGRVPSSPEHAIRILGSFEEGEMLRINVMRRQQRQTLELAVPAR